MHHTRETYKYTQTLGQERGPCLRSGKMSFLFDVVPLDTMFPAGTTSYMDEALT